MEEKEGNSTELRKIAGQKLDMVHVISNRSCEFETAWETPFCKNSRNPLQANEKHTFPKCPVAAIQSLSSYLLRNGFEAAPVLGSDRTEEKGVFACVMRSSGSRGPGGLECLPCPSQGRGSDLEESLATSSMCYYAALCVTWRSTAPLCLSISQNINLPFTLRQEKTLIPKSSYRHVIPFHWVQPVLWTEQTQCNFLSYNSRVCGIGQWNECSK